MLLLYTFCCYIEKYSKSELIKVLNILLMSIHKNILDYKLICFTNFTNELNKQVSKKYNIEYRQYYDKQKNKLYNDQWLNLSFNKINIYKDLYDEFNKDFCWIDLDTIICHDISYINDLSNIFIEIGGTGSNKTILFTNNSSITVPRNRYIQGNVWKLDINLYNSLMKTLDKLINKRLKLRYDLQDLFNYYIYIENNGHYKNINILGNNTKPDSMYGLSVWNKNSNSHPCSESLNNLYLDNNVLKTTIYPNKNIHILSLTFYTLLKIQNVQKFKELFIQECIC